jgi:hypothetical protein
VGAFIRIQAVKKRAFLNQVAQGAIASASTLTDALNQVQSQVYGQSFRTGRIVISQSGSGQSGSYQMNVTGAEWTQDNIFGLTQELIELIPITIANAASQTPPVTLADDGEKPSTLALIAAMNQDDSLIGVTEQHGDFTALRYPVTR